MSPRLEGKNLRLVSKDEAKTPGERHLVRNSHLELEDLEDSGNASLRSLGELQKGNLNSLRDYLTRHHPRIFSQFSRVDAEGFTKAGNATPFDLWLTGRGEDLTRLDKPLENLDLILPKAGSNVYKLALSDRQVLTQHFVSKAQSHMVGQVVDLVREDREIRQRINNVHDEVDRRVLQSADVIGITTTGLAKRISVLRHIGAKVVLCEEAGEVLEAHILSALIPSVQHLIQIGDHQQLRPQINDHNLSVESHQGKHYQLDRSQFERLSTGEYGKRPFPLAQLNVQRRMRPEIASLIRRTLYERLTDHPNTLNLPDVVGLRKNVFWLDHQHREDGSSSESNNKSKSNAWEVAMTHALVRHIVRQGVYSNKDIAVLTPYVGQLQKLRAAMREDFEVVLSDRDEEKLALEGLVAQVLPTFSEPSRADGQLLQKKAMTELLRVATVDNFQGEEAKVVVISLVRSNADQKVGFLKTTNRINVLLSRARHGMYLIGNADTYSNVPMWSTVLGMLRASESVGEAFDLRCPRHLGTEISVSNPEEFEIRSPEGGCREPCDRLVVK